ncbi:nucleotide exchange factor GrpE [Thalassotalea agarivorans]|uniref:Protein GrpE n=1 Tax=Thalassotalea agarivorans TaxID=349064 RepID=A0A1H9ZLN1_THASX|nr:nucleotide exchange factor GrpE [Thalassotalea agarivorans]SES82527.1 molecular chaperone GrpE [Thalassotalea agarivorans]
MTAESNESINKEVEDQNQEEVSVEEVATDEAVEGEVISAEQEKINELELKLAAAEAKVADQKDSVVRAKAEVENIRRRSAQDVEKARKFALEKFVNELLPVVDNLERAIESFDREDEAQKPLLEGVELTLQSFMSGLEKFDIQEINPKDEAFNPELHQAMSMQEIPGVAANTVVAVMQKGYSLNGRLVRPAMVMVAKG